MRESSFIVYFSVAVLIISIIKGAPIFIILSGFGILFFWYDYVPISAVIAESYRIVVSPHLATIPLFTLAGYFLAESKASDRLINVFKACFGWLPGGTPVIVLLICGFFTALTGGSGVTILALGGLLFPMLYKDGYKKNFSLGLITASGSIGLLFPPSLPLILYGVTAGISIKSIFLAGIIPGVFLIVILSIWSYLSGDAKKIQVSDFDGAAAMKAFQLIQFSDIISSKEKDNLIDALKNYCELDTLAMVMLFEHLNFLVQK